MYAKGLTTGEIQAHLAEIYSTEVSKDLISRVTDQVLDELTTIERAQHDYGVVINPRTMAVDPAATARERERRTAQHTSS